MANLFGYTGPQELPPIIFNIAYLTITIIVILLYSIKKIKSYQSIIAKLEGKSGEVIETKREETNKIISSVWVIDFNDTLIYM